MARVLVTESYLSAIGDAIRAKSLSEVAYTPGEMAQAILDIPSSGSGSNNEDKFISCSYSGPYINDRVTEINSSLFKEQPGLTSISFPKVISIANGAFKNSSVQVAHFPSLKAVSANAFNNCVNLTNIEMANVESIEGSAFYGCNNLINVILPSLKTVEGNAFSECGNLMSVDAPNLTTIGNYGFSGCSNLTTAIMPNLTEVGKYAFEGCSSLTNYEMPKVNTIDEYAFAGAKLSNVSFLNAISVGECAFEGSGLTAIELPKLTVPGGEAIFRNCSSMVSASMPNLTELSYQMFCGCSSLESIDLPMVINMNLGEGTHNTSGAFKNCSSLKNVNMPLLNRVLPLAFLGCSALESISLPSVTHIDDYAFCDCSSLKSLNFPKVETIDEYAFEDCIGLEEIPGNAFPNIYGIDIAAFRNCRNLKKITFDSSSAFEKYINSYAFEDCYELKFAEFKNNIFIDDYAFDMCTKLVAIVFRDGFTFDTSHGNTQQGWSISAFSCSISNYRTPVEISSDSTARIGYIYVPRAMIYDYNGGTRYLFDYNGKTYHTKILHMRALEDYTVDGTINGELDLVKMGLEAN